MKKIYVDDLLASARGEVALKLVAGEGGLRKKTLLPALQKAGPALTGNLRDVDPRKIQVLGKTEMSYLTRLSAGKRKSAVRGLFAGKAAAVLVTAGAAVPEEMLHEAQRQGVPLLVSPIETVRCIRGVIKVLEELSAEETTMHGVLVDIMGVGVLILGPSGIGKSECALELVVRGHRLVADDVVVLRKMPDGRLVGSGADLIRYLMEIRGLGVVSVKDLFGISSIKARKTLDMVVELVPWDEKQSYDRLGLEEKTYSIAGISLPYVMVPVTPGRNIAFIVEVAARNHALKTQGMNAATALDRRLSQRLAAADEEVA